MLSAISTHELERSACLELNDELQTKSKRRQRVDRGVRSMGLKASFNQYTYAKKLVVLRKPTLERAVCSGSQSPCSGF